MMETNNFDSLVGKIQLENLEIEENKIAQSLIAKSSTIWHIDVLGGWTGDGRIYLA